MKIDFLMACLLCYVGLVGVSGVAYLASGIFRGVRPDVDPMTLAIFVGSGIAIGASWLAKSG